MARKRLLKQIQSLITDNGNTYNNENETVTNLAPPVIENPQQFINYYAYALAMEDVILELEKLGALLKNLFGEVSTSLFKF